MVGDLVVIIAVVTLGAVLVAYFILKEIAERHFIRYLIEWAIPKTDDELTNKVAMLLAEREAKGRRAKPTKADSFGTVKKKLGKDEQTPGGETKKW